jgi:hypothetical protein
VCPLARDTSCGAGSPRGRTPPRKAVCACARLARLPGAVIEMIPPRTKPEKDEGSPEPSRRPGRRNAPGRAAKRRESMLFGTQQQAGPKRSQRHPRPAQGGQGARPAVKYHYLHRHFTHRVAGDRQPLDISRPTTFGTAVARNRFVCQASVGKQLRRDPGVRPPRHASRH